MIFVFKTALNIGALRIAGQPWAHAYIAAILIAQVGEFSFLLGEAGARSGLVGEHQASLIVTVTALSLVVSPFWQITARRLQRIAILGVTSRREVVRLFFGRHAPKVFAAGRALRGLNARLHQAARARSPRRRAGGATDPPAGPGREDSGA